MKACILEVNFEGLVCHFFYPDLGVGIFFEKEETIESGGIDFDVPTTSS